MDFNNVADSALLTVLLFLFVIWSSLSTGINYILSKPKGNDIFREEIMKENPNILQFEDTPTTLLVSERKSFYTILIFQDPLITLTIIC